VGFPGETAQDFEGTRRLVADLRFQNSFAFKYSTRPRTAAARLPDDVPLAEKKRRNQVLLKTREAVGEADHRNMVGRDVEVLVEGPSKKAPEIFVGRTRGNRIVHFPAGRPLSGCLVRVRIESATPLTVAGRVLE
jgi:tRNA-2-methylthio-N6-dimethylallyladenosine synthase